MKAHDNKVRLVKAIPVLILLLALALTVVAGLALAADEPQPVRQVLAGGASDSTAPGLTLRATLGQPFVSLISSPSGDITVGQGFWGLGARYHTYLPLLFRNHDQT
jgi:hypothetical protein